MAGTNPIPNAHGGHPIRIPPVRPLYRVAARGLGASMWFFVRFHEKAISDWKQAANTSNS